MQPLVGEVAANMQGVIIMTLRSKVKEIYDQSLCICPHLLEIVDKNASP